MSITENTLRQLLYKSEGVDLDFKQTQYRFIGASDHQKAELLKDILAMANSWRNETAYILVGIKDCSPSPAAVIGINEHIDDAQLQQFVNSKASPQVTFKYEERLIEGQTIGIISIPKQKRPFFISSQFGALKPNIVYVRRGSSTAEADPLEIVEMGKADSGPGDTQISIDLLNGENQPREKSETLRFLQFKNIPDFTYSSDLAGRILSNVHRANREYYRRLAEYISFFLGSFVLKVRVKNNSNFPLKNVKIELGITLSEIPYLFVPEASYPMIPTKEVDYIGDFSAHRVKDETEFHLEKIGGREVCVAKLGILRPGEDFVSTACRVRLGSCGAIPISIKVLAEELTTPLESTHIFTLTGEHESPDFESLLKMEAKILINRN